MAVVLGPAPQEAYYWNYAQHLDLSYFDHPPMTAYLIHFFTNVFGDNSFGIHFAAIFISVILSLVMFNFLGGLFGQRVAFWTVIACSTSLIFALGSIIITPDGPLLLFWLLFMMAFFRAVSENKSQWWFLSGLFLGAAMTSKYTAVFAGLGAAAYLTMAKKHRRLLLKPGPYLALIAALIVFVPVIAWNYQHDWASFKFQSGQRAAEAVSFRLNYLGTYFGLQTVMLGIFLMPVFIWGLVKAFIKRQIDSRMEYFFWFAFPMLVFFTIISPFAYVKMNWLAPVFLSGAPLAVYCYFESDNKLWKNYGKFALLFSIILTLAVHLAAILPRIGLGRADTIHGWSELAAEVESIKQEMSLSGKPFICGYEYKTASELKFHLPGHPETVSNNIVGENGLAYDYWSNPDTLIGKDCIFIYDSRNRYHGRLIDYFARVDEPEIFTAQRAGRKIADYYIYRCYNYRGIR
jgi:4-amino-4-deoxy-L-arabinose transferase-like glycosyltransferase